MMINPRRLSPLRSYCIVPYLRGVPKSKKIEQIITDIIHYSRYNHNPHKLQEVILTAINTEPLGTIRENLL